MVIPACMIIPCKSLHQVGGPSVLFVCLNHYHPESVVQNPSSTPQLTPNTSQKQIFSRHKPSLGVQEWETGHNWKQQQTRCCISLRADVGCIVDVDSIAVSLSTIIKLYLWIVRRPCYLCRCGPSNECRVDQCNVICYYRFQIGWFRTTMNWWLPLRKFT